MPVDGRAGLVADGADDRRDLDGRRDVVDVGDEHPDAEQQQAQADGGGDRRDEALVVEAAHRAQHEHGVDEGRDEHAERQLGDAVAQERPQHAR
ncbi:MAG: hypothetical protein M3P93_03935 [Actinomycetota bacterium]|nr:hypothetical protein [Actinomycetota bacterium]